MDVRGQSYQRIIGQPKDNDPGTIKKGMWKKRTQRATSQHCRLTLEPLLVKNVGTFTNDSEMSHDLNIT